MKSEDLAKLMKELVFAIRARRDTDLLKRLTEVMANRTSGSKVAAKNRSIGNPAMTQTVVIGGGVIGLSIAYELSKRNRRVVLLERDQVGRKASWFGAGILTPANGETAIHPLEQLESLSNELHPQWADELRQATGIDNGYAICGGLYVARTAGEIAALVGASQHWNERQIEFEHIDCRASGATGSRPRNSRASKIGLCSVGSPDSQPSTSAGPAWQLAVKTEWKLSSNVRRWNWSSKISKRRRFVSAINDYVAENYCIAGGPWSEQITQTVSNSAADDAGPWANGIV